MKKLIPFIFFAALTFYWFVAHQIKTSRSVGREVCNLVAKNYYRQGQELLRWAQNCLAVARAIPASTPSDEVVKRLNAQLKLLHTSHLFIFTQSETKEVWEGELKSNGLKFETVNGRFFVSQVLKGSPADRLGIKFGYEVLEINSQTNLAQFDLSASAGWFKFRIHSDLGESEKMFFLEPAEIKIDHRFQLEKLANLQILKVPSFMAEPFSEEAVTNLAVQLNKNKRPLVIDLRGNAGGSFVAMNRLLSVFTCGKVEHGLMQTSHKNMPVRELQDKLEDEILIADIQASWQVRIPRFKRYPCYLGPMVVLMDQHTNSTAEIFSQVLKSLVSIIGETSGGQVAAGVWYPLNILGESYTVSIPEAEYISPTGESIEGIGVVPSITAMYTVEDFVNSRDPFLEQARKDLKIIDSTSR